MSRSVTYEIILTSEPEGGFSVSVPDLPGCFTQGETIEEAKEMASEAIRLYIEALAEMGQAIPSPSLREKITVKVPA